MRRREFIAVNVSIGITGGAFVGVIVAVASGSVVAGAASCAAWGIAWTCGALTGWEARERA